MLFFFFFSFYRVNERPFVAIVESSIKYFFGTKLYIWHKTEKKITVAQNTVATTEVNNLDALIPKLSDSKLKELTWSLDINEKLGNSGTASEKFKV